MVTPLSAFASAGTSALTTTPPSDRMRLLVASIKGWAWADKNRDKAVDILVTEYPNLVRADEREAADVMLAYSFGDVARAQGWGTMDPANWADQIGLYSDLGQFTARTPKVDDVITLDLLKATQAARRV